MSHIAIQTTVSIAACVLSLAATCFAWQQIEISRTHNRLTVKPMLQLVPQLKGPGGRNGLYLTNTGLGPAIIKEFTVESGRGVFSGLGPDRWAEALSAARLKADCFATGWPRTETPIKAGDELSLLRLTSAENSAPCFAELVKLVGGEGVTTIIRYESVYDEPQDLRSGSKVPTPAINALYRMVMQK
ncbi:hypothetical protein [Variovorax paradoxus]|uniref:hypothetical protein n=1 Tax=Variovorax paradoxus TaxID=34073 RepID=UPI0027842456|nr:hypothetical protein [Variovorax paradoxus]MDQ0586647.1 hypothetical protein [Variovorax paradoxus]